MISTELSEVHNALRRRRVGRHERVQTLVGFAAMTCFSGAAGEFHRFLRDAGVAYLVTNAAICRRLVRANVARRRLRDHPG